MMVCKLCQERGKTWEGDDPKCAFESGVFDPHNWNCATMNALREKAEEYELMYRDDMGAGSIGVIPFKFGYIVVTWYKNRGRTGNALIMYTDEKERPLTEGLARLALGYDVKCSDCRKNKNGKCMVWGHEIKEGQDDACEYVV